MKLCATSRFPFVRLRDCGDIITGSTPPRANPALWGGEIPFVTPAQLGSQFPITVTTEYVTSEGACRGRLLPKDAVLVCCIGSLGKTGIAGTPLTCNQQVNAIIFDPIRVDVRYGYHAARGLVHLLEHIAPSTTLKIVKKSAFAEFQIPLPPLAKQKRFARILDAVDALRAKRREALAQLDALLQSTFLDMFGDPVTNPMGWEVRSMGDLAVKKPNNGVFRRNHEYSESLDSGLPVVWVAELFRGNRIDVSESLRLEATQTEIEKYGLLPGDLLFCRSSLKLDGIAYNNVFLGKREEALFECHLIRVSPRTDVVNPVFLNLQLRSVPMRALLKSKSKTATMTTIDQKALSSVEVVVPPCGIQNRFATIVESVEQQKASQRAHLNELDNLFASLQSRAFRGDL